MLYYKPPRLHFQAHTFNFRCKASHSPRSYMYYQRISFHRAICLLFLAIAIVISARSADAASGDVDPTFNPVPSRAPSPTGFVIQPDGKMIFWGDAMTADGVAKGRLARLNTNGSLDDSFDYCSCDLTIFNNAALQPDGKILIAGGVLGQAKILRLTGNGASNITFAAFPATFGTSTATLWAVQSDGKIIAQKTSSLQGTTNRTLYRFNTDGSVDGSFTPIDLGTGNSLQTIPNDLLVAPNGTIYIAATSFTSVTSGGSVRRYNADGTVDSTWELPNFAANSGMRTSVTGLDRQADGSIVAGGKFDFVNGVGKSSFVRLLQAGNVDLTFNSSGFTSGGYVKVLSSGKIVVTASTDVGGTQKLYRLNSNGSTDGGFIMDPSIVQVFGRWAVDSLGRILFFGAEGPNKLRFFRLDPDGGTDDSFLSNVGSSGSITALARQPDGKMIIAGDFIQMNGIPKSTIARLSPDGTLDPSFDPGTGFSTFPNDLKLQSDGKILAMGTFASYNGTQRLGFARINADGGLDAAFDPIFSLRPSAFVVQTDGKIVVVGNFSTVNGINRPLIARLNADGSLDQSLAPVIGGTYLTCVAIQSDGKILIGGSFSGVNGFNRSNLARLNADGSLDQSFNAGSPAGPLNIWIQPDSKILAGYTASIVRRNSDGSVDSSFAPPAVSASSSGDTKINSVVIQSDGSIIVGGNFNLVGTTIRNNLVRLSSTGSLDIFFFPSGANGEVRAAIVQPDAKIVLGGDFWMIGNTIRAGIARISTEPYHETVPYDFDGDGRADISVTRPGSSYTWYQLLGPNYTLDQFQFGISGDLVAPADYDGDGKTDAGIFRPSSGDWWYRSSIDGAYHAAHWGANGDIPLPSDYTGDGKVDFIVYRPSTGQWFRLQNGSPGSSTVNFGAAGDKPVIGDFDGDGKSDPAVFRPSTGDWWYQSSVDSSQHAIHWGANGDIPTPADFDGDGKTDLAVYRPSNGGWYIVNSSNGSNTILGFGVAEDKPIAADYDGDGKADIAVYRPSTGVWYLLRSTAGFAGLQWGVSTDIPSPNAFIQ